MKASTQSTFAYSLEFFVGLFVVIGLACFAYLAVNIAGIKLSDAGYYQIRAEFKDVSGLKLGAPIEVAGVKIGEVKDIRLEESRAMVTLQVREGYKLRDDDIAQVRTKGIIGDKYIRISPGASDIFLTAEDVMTDTESSVDFEEIIGKFIHSLSSDNQE